MYENFRSFKRRDIFVYDPPKQTLSAWKPFWDYVSVLFAFQNSDIDDQHPEWRLNWVAGCALLRTIGHVLQKVDAQNSDTHRRTINSFWSDWKLERDKSWIFWDFIENERNNILKNYEFGVETTNDSLVHKATGLDGIQLFRESLYWWRDQLESIEVGPP